MHDNNREKTILYDFYIFSIRRGKWFLQSQAKGLSLLSEYEEHSISWEKEI